MSDIITLLVYYTRIKGSKEVRIQWSSINQTKTMETMKEKHSSKDRKLLSKQYYWKGKYIPICLFDLAHRRRDLFIKTLIKIKCFNPINTQSVALYQGILLILFHQLTEVKKKKITSTQTIILFSLLVVGLRIMESLLWLWTTHEQHGVCVWLHWCD